jgi:transketolase
MDTKFAAYKNAWPELAEAQGAINGELPRGWDADIPVFPADVKAWLRASPRQSQNAIAPRLSALIGARRTSIHDGHGVERARRFEPPRHPTHRYQGSAGRLILPAAIFILKSANMR